MARTSGKAVIATVAEDRPGLVSELSEIVHSLGLNIEDSRMTVLGGEFAVLMAVAGEESGLQALADKLEQQAQGDGFVYLFRRTAERTDRRGEKLSITVAAMDHPGIVHKVTRFFSEHGANIRELSTEMTRAAHTGAPVFNLTIEIEISNDETVALQEGFQAFCEQEGLDGEISSP